MRQRYYVLAILILAAISACNEQKYSCFDDPLSDENECDEFVDPFSE